MPYVKLVYADKVCTITLNRPESLNAISLGLLEDLNAALVEAQASDDANCIVLHGEGKSFCAGDDLKAQGEIFAAGVSAMSAQVVAIQQVTAGIMFGPKPVIGAIEGWAVGAGLSWTLNCDQTVWGESAKGFFPEVGYGAFFSGGATYLLPACVGPARASEIMLSGRKMSAAELLELGWATHIVRNGEALEKAQGIAKDIAAKPIGAVRGTKKALLEPVRGLLTSAMAFESTTCLECAREETIVRMESGLKKEAAL